MRRDPRQAPPADAASVPRGVGVFRWVAISVAAFHLLLFLISCTLLVTQAGTVDSTFAQQAIKDHGGYIVLSSLALLRGYAIISLAYVLVLYPIVCWWLRRRRPTRRAVVWRTLLLSALCLALLFLRLMVQRPYFVTQWLPEWHFQIVPGAPGVLKDVALWTLLNGVPLLLLAAVGAFWIRHTVRLVRSGDIPRPRPAYLGVAALLAASAWVGPKVLRAGAHDSPTRPNIIIIASDSLRADHLSCNGYARLTSPNIDALAARSTNFKNCFTPIGSTLESMVGLLSSQYPHTHGVRHMFPDRGTVDRVNRDAPKLPEILAGAGYETAVIGDWCGAIFNEVPMGFGDVQVSQFDSFRIWLSQAVYLSHPVIPLYFDNEFGYWLFPKLQSFAHYLRPEVITERAVEKIRERGDDARPFFYTVFTGCNHFAYHAPYPYYQKWADPRYRGPNKYQVHFDPAAFVTDPQWDRVYGQLGADEKQHIIDLYDGCVSRFDDCVGRIVETLEKRGLMENTIVLVTSDHGEDLFEPNTTLTHGISFNGGDQGNHIPCVLYVPGGAPREVGDLVRNIDVAPTLLGLAGVPPEPRFEGTDLAPYLRGVGGLDLAFYGETGYPFARRSIPGEETLPVPPLDALTFIDDSFDFHIVLRPEFREALDLSKERCLRTSEWKLVFTPGAGGPIHRLYHLPSDPHCEHDVAAARPGVFAKMKYYLWRWITTGEEARQAEILDGPAPPDLQIPTPYREIGWGQPPA